MAQQMVAIKINSQYSAYICLAVHQCPKQADIPNTLVIGQVLRDPQSQRPESPLRQPKEAAHHAALALRLARIHVSVQEQRSEHEPPRRDAGGQLGVFQAGGQGKEHGLGRVLEEVGVGALGAVELLSAGLYAWTVSTDVPANVKLVHGMVSHVRLALLDARIAVGIRDLGSLAECGGDGPVDESQEGNRAQGDADDGASSRLA